VLIGKDTRISGYMLESALESGFNSAGVDVVLLGPLPTPGVAYLTRAQRASLGVVISASHNPFPDNGIKFFSALGAKLPDAWEAAVEAALEEEPVWADSANLGKTRRLEDASGRYIEFCKSTFANDLTLKGVSHRGGRGPRCGLPDRAQGLPRTGCRGVRDRLRRTA
jgi:phosphoglucosamine mutase